jgi:transposase InsO family protein
MPGGPGHHPNGRSATPGPAELIVKVHHDSRGTYGALRVHAELRLGHGIVVGHNAIALLMRRAGLAGATGRPRWRHAKPDQVAADLVDRQFSRAEPNQLWVTDITEHPTREGKVYCAVVLDTFSRRVVGWSIDATPTAALVTNALGMAIQTRTPPAGAIDDPLNPGSSRPGRSPNAPRTRDWCPRSHQAPQRTGHADPARVRAGVHRGMKSSHAAPHNQGKTRCGCA